MENRTIIISGPINSAVATMVCLKIEKLALESKEDIYVKISSYGGCIASMLAIVDCFDTVPNDIVTIVKGKAMSAGSFISVHGTPGKRYAHSNASYMFHEPNGFAELTEKGIEHMMYVKELTTKLLAERTGLSIAEMEKIADRDFYTFASDLIDHPGSFVDHLV
ncbi:ATP-dependent Clp protease proteolytic subunit [Vibrio phage BONAISHI]|nr:ATP-dependent Clp protease proteolytic subunit [Vibrio phage BONAISHI]